MVLVDQRLAGAQRSLLPGPAISRTAIKWPRVDRAITVSPSLAGRWRVPAADDSEDW